MRFCTCVAHHCRRGERDAALWNQAGDYAINPILINNGITVPKDAVIDPAFADLSAEEIYARLLKQGQDSGKTESPPQSSIKSANVGNGGNGPEQAPQPAQQRSEPTPSQLEKSESAGVSAEPVRPGGFGEVLDAVGEDGKPTSQAELTRETHEWAINAEHTLCSAKACGHEPGGIERLLEQARQSERDWRTILRDSIGATSRSDYRWAPPNRRFVSSGLYLPSAERSCVGDIVIAVNTSGLSELKS